MTILREQAKYVTCPLGHKVFVIWSPQLQRFGFTCDECGQHSIKAVSVEGIVEVVIVNKGRKS